MTSIDKVLNIARNEIGYHEAGNNITKYADEIDRTAFNTGPKNGYAWCAVFQEWLFFKAFGERMAMKMLNIPNGSSAAGCESFMQYFIGAGAFHRSVPKPGDIVFFYSGDGVNHVGIVERVEEAVVHTIEGNSCDAVRRNSYMIGDRTIAGYGVPNYALIDESIDEAVDEPKQRSHFCLQYGTGLNNPLPRVKAWQALLCEWGFICDIDGEYGSITEEMTKRLQSRLRDVYGANIEPNGIVDDDEWYEAVKVEVR